MKVKIFDCFIFSNELHILDLRLEYLYDEVDYFVIVESERTLSGSKKKLEFLENRERYSKYSNKIIHLVCPNIPEMKAWDYEFYQRNYIKEGLKECSDNDIVFVSDVDEIIDLKTVLENSAISLPAIICLPTYYYFLNLRSDYAMPQNLVANYGFIKERVIGQRMPTYSSWGLNIYTERDGVIGWHFSFLFGFNIELYKNKIKSYSHQEYNNSYYLNDERIMMCIKLGIDFFERGSNMYRFVLLNDRKLLDCINKVNLSSYVYYPSKEFRNSIKAKVFILRKKKIPFILYNIKRTFLTQVYPRFAPVWRWLKNIFFKK